MQIYLPIAELPVSILMLLGMGAAVGFISGLFGVGGGFLLTPLLIFTGIPPAVAVATVTSQTVASSTSGALSYWRRQAIDLKLASVLISGGIVGSALGVFVFRLLREVGQLDLIISISYLTFLTLIGVLMLRESIRAMLKNRDGKRPPARMPGQHSWVLGLPLKMKFRRSKLYVSVLPVLGLGISIGFMGSVLGIGGGFIMVPALIYLLRVPTAMVIGTSLFYILVTMSVATVLHASTNQTVDVVLALCLMIGGVFGAQFGAQLGQRLRGEQIRALLGLLVLAVGMRFAVNLVLKPDELYSFSVLKLMVGG